MPQSSANNEPVSCEHDQLVVLSTTGTIQRESVPQGMGYEMSRAEKQ